MHPTPLQSLVSQPFLGEPTAYSLRTDDCVAMAFVLSFLCMAWVVAHSRQFIIDSFVNILEDNTRCTRFTKRATHELQGIPLLIIQAALGFGLISAYFANQTTTAPAPTIAPHLIVPISALVATCYYVTRVAIYAGINSVFFTPQKVKAWTDFYLLSLLIEGAALTALSLASIYTQLNTTSSKVILILLLIGLEIPRFVKLKSIFFPGFIGSIHIFLYFCTLNLAPMLLVWQILTNFNTQFS